MVDALKSCDLIDLLKNLGSVEEVTIRTLGGFQFAGRLIAVEDALADLTDAEVLFPGGDEIDFDNLTVNLLGMVSFGVDD